ncbi:MAG: hypothetical protein A2017_06930 [Lentisphaerae bacterium GWF2_44_16]|nr:MAG: hypothetical protein A2017_06930 [Lentisphaerae bacterium GWF2_44_16]
MKNLLKTFFAPAERSSARELQKSHEYFSNDELLRKVLNCVPDILLVLNKNRQVVYANKTLYNALGIKEFNDIRGMRPGEILNCVHAEECGGGCGTSEFCRECGAANAIIQSLIGYEDVRECRIMRKDTGEAFDFRVWAFPLSAGKENFSIFTAKDIRHEKRREVLERIFFHDIMNIAGNFVGITEMLEDIPDRKISSYVKMLRLSSEKLIDEINSQRELMLAENCDLKVNPVQIDSSELLKDILETCKTGDAAAKRHIKIGHDSHKILLISDIVLLRRVMGNMIKNAFEASKEGESVTVNCEYSKNNDVVFSVHNKGFIKPEVQHQIFQRSFSTKGPGRGLGAYSIKLLTERYLKGKASFESSPEKGTVFKITLPLSCV